MNNEDISTWALPEGAIARFGRGKVRDITFSLDGEHLFVATANGLWLYELTTQRPVALWDTERGMVCALSLPYNRQKVASGNSDGIVKVWDIQKQQLVFEVGERTLNGAISRIAVSPDRQYLAASRPFCFTVSIWCAKTGVSITDFTAETPKSSPRGRSGKRPICFSPDSLSLAYMLGENTIAVTRLETGVPDSHFTIDSGHVNPLVFSPCGQFLAASVQRRDTEPRSSLIYVWNVPKQTLEISSEYSGYWTIPTYLPDGTLRVAEVHDNEVVIWDTFQQEKRGAFEHRGGARAARFSSDGQQFAIASPYALQVWRENAPQVVSFQGHPSFSHSVKFTQNGKTLVSGHLGGDILFWNVSEKRAQQTFRMDIKLPFSRWGHSGGLAVSPDEEFVATRCLKTIEVWHVASRTRIMTFTEPQSVGKLAFSPTSECFVSTTIDDGTLYMWDVNRWEKRETLYGHTEYIRDIAFHPDGKILVTASQDGTTAVWDVARGSRVTSLSLAWPLSPDVYKGDEKAIERALKVAASHSQNKRAHDPEARHRALWKLTFSPCSTLLAGGRPNEIRLWDATTYETQMIIFPPKESNRPFSLAFSPCGRYLASGSWWAGTDKVSIRLWDVATGENIHTFWGHSTDVQDLTFSPDSTLLASAGFDGILLLWDMKPYL